MASNCISPAQRGYLATYRENETNHCPGCGRTQWLIGRASAECAFCATALPLAASGPNRAPVIWERGRKTKGESDAAL
jgi:hypothetical protein